MIRLTLCLSIVLTSVLLAQEKGPEVPKAPPYLEGIATIQGAELMCKMAVIRYEMVEKRFKEVQGGKTVVRSRFVTIPVKTEERAVLPLKGVQGHVVSTKGNDPTKVLQPLDAATLPEAIRKGTPVVFIRAGARPEPMHFKGLKDGTIVLTVPKAEPPRDAH